ncbi:MAG: metallophosphoesterase family protein [Promethearchaeota archaeon]
MTIKGIKHIFYVIFLLSSFCNLSGSSNSIWYNHTHLKHDIINNSQVDKNTFNNFGSISSDGNEILWFIQITDTQFLWYDEDKISDFYEFLNNTYKTIKPLFIYHTGDIVDANHGLEQDVFEWKRYRKALNDNSMNASNYMDIIGNHDAIGDIDFRNFLNYSMMGHVFNTTQYSFNKSFNFGDFAFIGLNTAKKSYNLFEFGFLGFLNSKELDWYENQLEKYKDFNRIFVFGHHPIEYPPFYKIISAESSSGNSFNDLNKEYNISYYLSGHIHEDSFQYFNNDLLTITTRNFDAEGGTYRLISLDNNSLSTSIGHVGIWPEAIITHPASEDYHFRNLNIKDNKIRVLAWDPKGISSVEWCFFDKENRNQLTDWEPLKKNSHENLWHGDITFKNRGILELNIKIEGGSGTKLKKMRYYLETNEKPISFLILIIILVGFISISVILNHYFPNKTNKTVKIIKNKRL